MRRLARAFAQLYVEVEGGRRTPAQIAPLLTRDLYLRLGPMWARPQPPAVVDEVIGMHPTPDTFEAVAMLRRSGRRTALAFRFSRHGQSWVCDELGAPEHGPWPRKHAAGRERPGR